MVYVCQDSGARVAWPPNLGVRVCAQACVPRRPGAKALCVDVRGGWLLGWSQEEASLGLGLPFSLTPKKSRVCFSWSQ